MNTAYCVKCRKIMEMKDEQEVILKNGRNSLQGKCIVCGTKMCKIIGKK